MLLGGSPTSGVRNGTVLHDCALLAVVGHRWVLIRHSKVNSFSLPSLRLRIYSLPNAFPTIQRSSAAPNLPSRPLRYWRPRSRGLPVRRLPPRRRTDDLAGIAAESDGLCGFAVPMLFRVCGEPAVT